ncbi:hypothetical protein ACLB2K_061005 [Fragaria x ananassa]
MEKMELDLKEYEMKKNSMSKMYESLYSQSSSMLVFTLQWKELEERLDSIRDKTQTRFKEIHEREQQLDVKELKVSQELKELKESKANEVVEFEKLIDEKQKEVTDTRNYLNSLQSLIKQMERRIQELNGVERNIEEKSNKSREELNLIQRKITEQSKILDLKEKQIKAEEEKLNEIVKSIEEKSKLASEEQKKAFDMEQLEEKLKEQKKSAVEVSKTLKSGEDIMRKVELKIKDQSLRQKSMEEWSCNLRLKERELEVKEQLVLSKAEEVDALNKRSLEEFRKEVEKQEAYSQRLQLKERELEVKSDTMEKLHQEREKQLEAKERQLVVKSDAMEKLHQEREKQLEAKERQLVVKSDTMEKLHQELLKQLKAKEKHLEEQGKELEFSKKQFGSQIKVNSEPLENTPAAINDANELQGLLKVVDQHEQATELSCTLGTTDKAPAYNISVASDNIEKAVSPAEATFSSPNLQPTAKNNIIVAPSTIRKRFGRQAAIKAIERFIQQKKLVKAYGRIHKFKLFHKFPAGRVLKEYVEKAMKCMENRKRKKMLYEQDQLVNKGIVDLRHAIQCIKVHNLKSQYTTESIEKQILVLQKFMEDRKNENQKKRLCSTVDPSFQQHEHKFQRTSLSADRPSGFHLDYLNPGSLFYNGQFSFPSNNYPMQLSMPANIPLGYGNPGFVPQNPY